MKLTIEIEIIGHKDDVLIKKSHSQLNSRDDRGRLSPLYVNYLLEAEKTMLGSLENMPNNLSLYAKE